MPCALPALNERTRHTHFFVKFWELGNMRTHSILVAATECRWALKNKIIWGFSHMKKFELTNF